MRPWDESESIHNGAVDNRKAGTIASGNQVRDTYNHLGTCLIKKRQNGSENKRGVMDMECKYIK